MKIDECNNFLDDWFLEIEKLGISTFGFSLDHLGFSVSSSDLYDLTKKDLLKYGKLVREAIVSDRRVAIFRFNKPLVYKNHKIYAMELIEPKTSEKTTTGFEHAEFTIKFPFEKLIEKYPNFKWDTTNINRSDFPRLKLALSGGMELKFNYTPILQG